MEDALAAVMKVIVDIAEPVFDETIHDGPMTQPVSVAGFLQKVRRIAHTFHSTRNHNIRIASANGLGSQHHRLEPRATDLTIS